LEPCNMWKATVGGRELGLRRRGGTAAGTLVSSEGITCWRSRGWLGQNVIQLRGRRNARRSSPQGRRRREGGNFELIIRVEQKLELGLVGDGGHDCAVAARRCRAGDERSCRQGIADERGDEALADEGEDEALAEWPNCGTSSRYRDCQCAATSYRGCCCRARAHHQP